MRFGVEGYGPIARIEIAALWHMRHDSPWVRRLIRAWIEEARIYDRS